MSVSATQLCQQGQLAEAVEAVRLLVHTGYKNSLWDVFNMVAKPGAFTWSAIISLDVEQGRDMKAMQPSRRMRRPSLKPNGDVLVAALQACARGADQKSGQQVQSWLTALRLIGLHLLGGHECGSLAEARRVFDGCIRKMW